MRQYIGLNPLIVGEVFLSNYKGIHKISLYMGLNPLIVGEVFLSYRISRATKGGKQVVSQSPYRRGGFSLTLGIGVITS